MGVNLVAFLSRFALGFAVNAESFKNKIKKIINENRGQNTNMGTKTGGGFFTVTFTTTILPTRELPIKGQKIIVGSGLGMFPFGIM